MAELQVLNTRKVKQFKKIILEQWGVDFDDSYLVLWRPDGSTYIVNKEIKKIDLSKLRIKNLGLFFAEWSRKDFCLSIEGSQIIGPKAKRNVIEFDKKQAEEWLLGQDAELTEKQLTETKGCFIVKYKKDFLGSGKIKNKVLQNSVPKTRRIGSIV
ncbi:hypothetical protein GF371_04545 [Candidatus Woesearchaeota archaeon]|nr:hypothetical protein [Candidatus Woesearchaeota archaeon]